MNPGHPKRPSTKAIDSSVGTNLLLDNDDGGPIARGGKAFSYTQLLSYHNFLRDSE